MIKQTARNIYSLLRKSQIPKSLKRNHITLEDSQFKRLEDSLKMNFFQGFRSKENYTSVEYSNDLETHLIGRLEYDRIFYIPWINNSIKLDGAKILEIGCGTGSSTVAFAEQGACITGVDIDEGALNVAHDRCEIYGVKADLIHGNTDDVIRKIAEEVFDLVIFFASMEHMIYSERVDSLRKYYNILPNEGHISIVEAPNRLWYMDSHTSQLPFFQWLPDNLAFDYSKFSLRNNFKELYHEYSDDRFIHFLRQGRGFSFHELELALNIPAANLEVVDYYKRPLIPFSFDKKFYRFLTKIYPNISKGFFYPLIDVIIKKTTK